MTGAKTRYCAYCQRHKPDVGFTFIFHAPSNSRRAQCEVCKARRQLPREELNKLAQQEVAARREQTSIKVKAALERKRKGEQ